MRFTRRRLLAGSAGTAVVGVAGCLGGGAGDEGDGTDETTTEDGGDTTVDDAETTTDEETVAQTTGTVSAEGTVRVSSHPDLGEILVGPNGMTLYMFDQDTQGSGASACTGGCAESWPPLEVEGESTAGDGVTVELTTFERDDGTRQVAANGWPLYYFAQDSSPGDANGQGVNDVWWVLRSDGTPVKSSGTTTSGPGYDATAR